MCLCKPLFCTIFVLLIITYIVIFHKCFFQFFQNILKSLRWLTSFVSIFYKKCAFFNIHDNKETNLFFVSGKKHFLLLILFLNYYKMNKKCVENIY